MYFDCNEFHDSKIRALIDEDGLAGYGMFCLLRIHLMDTQRIIFTDDDIPYIARIMSARPSKLKKVVSTLRSLSLLLTVFDEDRSELFHFSDQIRSQLDKMPRKSAKLRSMLLYLSTLSLTLPDSSYLSLPPPLTLSSSLSLGAEKEEGGAGETKPKGNLNGTVQSIVKRHEPRS